MPNDRHLRILTIALLLLTPGLPGASAAAVDFTVDSVMRTDSGAVYFGIHNRNQTFTNVTVSLHSDGALAATPERFIPSWSGGQRMGLSFDLIREVESGELVLRYDSASGAKTTTIPVAIPARNSGGGASGEPRLSVVGASEANGTFTVRVENTGSAAATNALVSLESKGVKVGEPLYRRISSLAVDEDATVNFSLEANDTLTQVTVVLEYGDRSDRVTVGLAGSGGGGGGGGDGGAGDKNLTAFVDLPFLEAEPGDTVRFTITVTNGGPERRLDLTVEPLPDGWRTAFFQGPARISSLLLKEGESRRVGLEVSIPSNVDRVGATVPVVAVMNAGEDAARAEMSVTLHGRGQLDVEVPNAFGKVAPGESATFNVTVSNTGTGVLRNVRVRTDLPFGWLATMTPDRIWELRPGQSQTVQVVVTAPDDAGEGQRPFDLTVSATDADARSRTLTLDVATPESSGALWVLLVGAALAGMAAIIVKVRRK